MSWWQLWKQTQQRRLGRKRDKKEEQGFIQQWFLLAAQTPLESCLQPTPAQMTPIYPPNNTFWADPFIWSHNNKHYIFFEDFPFATWRGHISVISLDANLQPEGEAIPVLQEPYHLSYPFLFEYEGNLYMIPEKTEVNRIDLYRCVEFPHRWEFVHTLMDGIKAADSTLLEHDGKWWLLCAAKQGRVRINESLFVFMADSPLSQKWQAHPRNPVLRDLAKGRPAGRIFQAYGSLWRPSQDCVRRYGYGLNLNKIESLTPCLYQESNHYYVNSNWEIGVRANHHLDWHKGLMVMDAQRLLAKDIVGDIKLA